MGLSLSPFEVVTYGLEKAKQYTTEIGAAVASAIGEINDQKADKLAAQATTIPTSGWHSDSNADFPKYYDLAVSGVTVSDRADIAIAPDSIKTAIDCGMCPSTETLNGAVRIRAANIPSSSVTANIWILKG